ncbi:MAG: hypothetical protein ACK5LC_10765 [Coprobacillaceae bacterium]
MSIPGTGAKPVKNITDDTDEIAKNIRNINKQYSSGYEINNSIDSILNSASYYDDTYDQTSAVTRSIVDHVFENGNKRIALVSTLIFLLTNQKELLIRSDLYEICMKLTESKLDTS